MSSSTTRSPGQAGRSLWAEPDRLAEHLVEEEEAAVAVGQREAERQAVEQGVDVRSLVVAARARHVVEQEEGRERLGAVAGRDLDDAQAAAPPCPRRRSGTGRSAAAARWSTSGVPSTATGSPSGPTDPRGKGAVGGEDRARRIDDRGHQPGLAHAPARFAGDQPARLGGEIGRFAAPEPPEQMAAADQRDLAAYSEVGEAERRHDRLAVAAGGADRGLDGGAVAFPGEVERARPAAPNQADQVALAQSRPPSPSVSASAQRRAVERGAQQSQVGASRLPPAPYPRTAGANAIRPPAPISPARKAAAKTGLPAAQSSRPADATAARPNSRAGRPNRCRPMPGRSAALAILPDADPALGREEQGLARRGAEGRIPGIEIAHDGDALLGRRMRIGQQPLQQIGLAIFAPPDLRPAEIETLVAGHAVDHRRRPAAQRMLVGVIGDGEAGEVGDILAERERALDVAAGQRLIGVILGDELRGQRIEAGAVLRRPPLPERAGLVIMAALVVEMVADLVADDRGDAAIIDRRIGMGVEEGRLQDRRRERRSRSTPDWRRRSPSSGSCPIRVRSTGRPSLFRLR